MISLMFLLLILLAQQIPPSSSFFLAAQAGRGPPQFLRPLHAKTYTVTLGLPPLGIVFEEITPGLNAGVVVADLLPGSKGEKCGAIRPGDKVRVCEERSTVNSDAISTQTTKIFAARFARPSF